MGKYKNMGLILCYTTVELCCMFYTEVVVYQYEEYSYKKATTFINFLPDMLRQNVICYLGSKSDILPTELLAPLHAYYVP